MQDDRTSSSPYNHKVTAALRRNVQPGVRARDPGAPPPRANGPARRSLPERAARRALRPFVARFVVPLIAHQVDARISAHLALQASEDESEYRLEALEVNAELLKTELRSVNSNLEALKQGVVAMAEAVAPTAGLAGVPARMAELRERLNAVERRTRGGGAAATPVSAAGATDPAAPGTASSPVDYVGFERRFRGDPEEVQAITRERYLDLLRGSGPVLDVGCGKGELIGTLTEAGVAARGIDLDPGMVAEAVAQGRDVQLADLNDYLSRQHPGSLGAIIATQVVEHLQVADLVRFLELSASRLRPGGVFVAETPNPASLIVLGTHFILDPTHVRPLHPALLVYLCESAGFRSIDVRFFAPATEHHLALLDEAGEGTTAALLNANFRHLNEVLFGPQDYAVVARTPDETDTR